MLIGREFGKLQRDRDRAAPQISLRRVYVRGLTQQRGREVVMQLANQAF